MIPKLFYEYKDMLTHKKKKQPLVVALLVTAGTQDCLHG